MAGRRKGEERRVNHDLFVGIRKWKELDRARIRELYESSTLQAEAHHFLQTMLALAPDLEPAALEGLAHSLIRDALKQLPQQTTDR